MFVTTLIRAVLFFGALFFVVATGTTAAFLAAVFVRDAALFAAGCTFGSAAFFRPGDSRRPFASGFPPAVRCFEPVAAEACTLAASFARVTAAFAS